METTTEEHGEGDAVPPSMITVLMLPHPWQRCGGSIKHGSIHTNTSWPCSHTLVMNPWQNPMRARQVLQGLIQEGNGSMVWLGNANLGQPEREEQWSGLHPCPPSRGAPALQSDGLAASGNRAGPHPVPSAFWVRALPTLGGWKAAKHLLQPQCGQWFSVLETSGALLVLLHPTSATCQSCSKGW